MLVRRRVSAVVRVLTVGVVATFVATATGSVAMVAVVGGATPAAAGPGFSIGRLAGGDRYATAAQVALDAFGSADAAVLASGENFPDALAGNYLAGRREAPVLLTARSTLPSSTRQALQQLGVDQVTLLGGDGAIGAEVEAAVAALGITVDRVAGPDRFTTAAAVARVGGPPPSGVALLASGRSFPDALAAGPIAYGSSIPQLLTEPNDLPAVTADALAELGIHTVVLLGGTSVVGPAVVAELNGLGISQARLAGPNRYATATAIADWAVGALGHRRDHVDFATGGNFPDALAGGAHAGRLRSTVLLVEPEPAGGAAARYLTTHAEAVAGGHAFGGPTAVSDEAIRVLEATGNGVPAPALLCETVLLTLINGERLTRSLPAFSVSEQAAPIARTWSAGMAAAGGLSHNPNVSSDLTSVGVPWTAWAENVSFGASPAHVHSLLMSSPTHRGNILSPELTHVAVGCNVDAGGTHWVTQIFYRA